MKPIPHGTLNGYGNYGCRCDLCKKAKVDAQREKLQRGKQSPETLTHGKRSTYQTYGCRCDLCRRANLEYDRQRLEKNPEIRKQKMETTRRYRARHPERVKESYRKTHAKRKLQFWDELQAAQKLRNDAYRLRSKGLEPATEAELLALQDRRCAVCRREDTRKLSIDHCHETGRVRGLLCRRCNLGLGCFGDDPELLRAAAAYLIEEEDA